MKLTISHNQWRLLSFFNIGVLILKQAEGRSFYHRSKYECFMYVPTGVEGLYII